MSCVSPPELEDSRILSYLDGKGNDSIADHLARCPHCREKADQLARLHDRLTARLYRVTCPSSVALGEYHLSLLSTDQMVGVAQHVRECPHCKREVAELRDYLRELSPEAGLLDRMKVLIARLVGSGPGVGQSSPALAGIRGDARGPVTLEADGILIVLDVQPTSEGHVTVLGQIASEDQDRWTGAAVELRQADELRMTVTVDDLGAFRCEEFSPGPTQILITPSSGSSVLIPNVEIVV